MSETESPDLNFERKIITLSHFAPYYLMGEFGLSLIDALLDLNEILERGGKLKGARTWIIGDGKEIGYKYWTNTTHPTNREKLELVREFEEKEGKRVDFLISLEGWKDMKPHVIIEKVVRGYEVPELDGSDEAVGLTMVHFFSSYYTGSDISIFRTAFS